MSSIAIAIHVTRPCDEAIRGLLANRGQIKEVHLIHPTYENDEVSMYRGWVEDRKKLESSEILVQFDAKLNARNFENAAVIVEVPPNCLLTLGAFDTIREQMKNASETQTHFALTTGTKIERFSLTHGFLVVLTLIEWIWNRIFERNKLIEATDVRGRFMLKKGTKLFLPKESQTGWRIWNSSVMPKVYSTDVAVLSNFDIFWRLRHHVHLGLGLWIFSFIAIWLSVSVSWVTMIWSAITFRSVWMGTYAFTIWTTEVLLCMLICGHYIKSKWNLLFYLAFPLYFLLFPFVLVYSKLKVN